MRRHLVGATVIAVQRGRRVIAGLLSIFVFGERDHGRMRIAAIIVITGGLAVLAFSV